MTGANACLPRNVTKIRAAALKLARIGIQATGRTEHLLDSASVAFEETEAIIAAQSESFLRWLEGRAVVPMITALHGHHDALRASELERAKRLLGNGTSPEQVLEQLARGLTSKFLHGPTQALNQAGEAERAELLALFQRVYHLPDEP